MADITPSEKPRHDDAEVITVRIERGEQREWVITMRIPHYPLEQEEGE